VLRARVGDGPVHDVATYDVGCQALCRASVGLNRGGEAVLALVSGPRTSSGTCSRSTRGPAELS
jgi:hypothetical protein